MDSYNEKVEEVWIGLDLSKFCIFSSVLHDVKVTCIKERLVSKVSSHGVLFKDLFLCVVSPVREL